jgi:transitional endoplasmic reticulum ATPase
VLSRHGLRLPAMRPPPGPPPQPSPSQRGKELARRARESAGRGREEAENEAEAMEEVEAPSLSLRVIEALLDDVDRGIVRVDPYLLAQIGVLPGTPVTVSAQRSTVAVAQAIPHTWHGRREIQMDGMVRENARAVLHDLVTVSPVEAAPARTLLLRPLDPATYGPEEVARIREELSGRVTVYGDRLKITAFSRVGHLFRVTGTEPEGAVVVGPYTDVRIQKDPGPQTGEPLSRVKYEDIGGLEEELLRVRELVELPLKYPSLFARLKIEPPKGVLIYGPPGSGKTLIARAVAGEARAHFVHVNGPEIIHKFYGESEARLREIFEEAQRRAPSVIFLDELDAIAPKRLDVSGEVEKRVVAQLLALMDGMVRRGEVVVIAATNLPEAVDPALRRPGRFDREIPIGVPSQAGRLRILQIHTRGMPLAEDVDLVRLAEVTHGFVGADLEALCKEAGMHAVRDRLSELASQTTDPESLASGAVIRGDHFLQALKAIEPTATREFALERPNVRWEDVGGVDDVRRVLVSALELPRRFPRLFEESGVQPPNGFLFVGPSGTGKTLTAKALATETGLRLITVDPALVYSKWVGETEKAIRQVFRKAKQAAPCILFFEALDALVPRARLQGEVDSGAADRLASQLFSELDQLNQLTGVVLVAASNRPQQIDPALLRPGRFGFTFRFTLPDASRRREILAIHLRRVALSGDVDLAELAAETEGASGAQLAGLCQRAVLMEIERLAAHLDRDPGSRLELTPWALRRALAEAVRAGKEEEHPQLS